MNRLVLILVASNLLACGSDEFIIAGRSLDPCLENIPACPPEGTAECILSPTRYAERDFPGVFSFLVDVDAGNDLELTFLLARQEDAGLQTQIVWNEPGCSDGYFYDSNGADLFDEARDIGTFTRTETMQESGEHLVVIDTDMRARVLITVDVVLPGTR